LQETIRIAAPIEPATFPDALFQIKLWKLNFWESSFGCRGGCCCGCRGGNPLKALRNALEVVAGLKTVKLGKLDVTFDGAGECAHAGFGVEEHATRASQVRKAFSVEASVELAAVLFVRVDSVFACLPVSVQALSTVDEVFLQITSETNVLAGEDEAIGEFDFWGIKDSDDFIDVQVSRRTSSL